MHSENTFCFVYTPPAWLHNHHKGWLKHFSFGKWGFDEIKMFSLITQPKYKALIHPKRPTLISLMGCGALQHGEVLGHSFHEAPKGLGDLETEPEVSETLSHFSSFLPQNISHEKTCVFILTYAVPWLGRKMTAQTPAFPIRGTFIGFDQLVTKWNPCHSIIYSQDWRYTGNGCLCSSWSQLAGYQSSVQL